jgi:type I restriction enzyme M protein
MPDIPAKTRRAALEVLSRDVLATITANLNLTVEDRRAQTAHVEAIMRSRSVDFGDVLRQLSRDDLKAICAALGLDTSGKEKEVEQDRAPPLLPHHPELALEAGADIRDLGAAHRPYPHGRRSARPCETGREEVPDRSLNL